MSLAISSSDFWNTLALLLVVIPVTLVAALALIDIFRRSGFTRAQRAVWALAIVLIPLIGSICYLLMRPEVTLPLGGRNVDDTPAGHGVGSPTTTRAEQLHMLSRLHDAGKLTDSEFAAAKIRVLRENGVTIDR